MVTFNIQNLNSTYFNSLLSWFFQKLYPGTSMSIFEDTFTVTAVDPDGKVFERGTVSFSSKIVKFTC